MFICLQLFCNLLLYYILHTIEMFKHATSHKTDWITTDCRLLCLALLQSNKISQTNVLEAEDSRTNLPENSIATACICAFSCLPATHTCCYWFIWRVFCVFVQTLRIVVFIFSISCFHADALIGGLLVIILPHLAVYLLVYLYQRKALYSSYLLFSFEMISDRFDLA